MFAQAFAVFSSANFQRSIVCPFRGERVDSLPKCAHPRKGENELFSKKCFSELKTPKSREEMQYNKDILPVPFSAS